MPRATRQRENSGEALSLSRSVLDHVIRLRQGLIISDIETGSLIAESFAGTGIRTALCVPIFGRDGEPIGIIQLDSRNAKAVFGPEDLELLAAVAVPIGVVVENHRMLKEKALGKAATEVQMAMLPQRRPSPPGYRFWDYYQPALEVGGDYYDYIPFGSGPRGGSRRMAAVGGRGGGRRGQGDAGGVDGGGVDTEVRHLVRSGGDLVVVAEAVDRDLCEANISSRFITFLLIALDAQSHRLVIVNAGHICPIIRRAGGRLEFIGEEEKGLPLGIDSNASYQTVSVDLEAGDVVVLYTDGLTDITNRDGSMFGQAAGRGVGGGDRRGTRRGGRGAVQGRARARQRHRPVRRHRVALFRSRLSAWIRP